MAASTIDLVTLEAAKNRLRILDDDEDVDIQAAVTQASAVVLDYVKKPDTAGMTDIQIACMQAATLIMIGYIYDGDGTKAADYSPADGYIPKQASNLLHRIRDLTVV